MLFLTTVLNTKKKLQLPRFPKIQKRSSLPEISSFLRDNGDGTKIKKNKNKLKQLTLRLQLPMNVDTSCGLPDFTKIPGIQRCGLF